MFEWLRRKRSGPELGHGISAGWGVSERICYAAEPQSMEAKYSLADARVLPPPRALTEADARHLIAEGLLKITHEQGPTRVALTIGSDEKTVRRARDKETTLRVDFFLNLLLADEHALDPALAHFGKKLVDLDPRPVNWLEFASACNELSAAVHMAFARGGITHVDLPKLRQVARKVLSLGHSAGVTA